MKILKLSPYYFPEQISSSHLTEDLENAYINAGFDIVIHVPTPTRGVSQETFEKYKQIKNEKLHDGHITVHRFRMFREGRNPIQRVVRYIFVNFIQYLKAGKEKEVDIIVAGSTPPTQGLLCSLVKRKLNKKFKRPISFVFVLQDVFPDSLVQAGMSRKGSLIWKIGRKIENYTYTNADVIIVISEDIKRNIMKKGVPESKIEVVRNWIDTHKVHPVSNEDNSLRTELGLKDDAFYVVYAGNLGKAQGVNILVEAAEILRGDSSIKFLIFGNGAEEEIIRKKIHKLRLDNVRLFPLQPPSRISEVYSLGDVCIVTCKKGNGQNAFPSKTVSIMSTGTPIIAAFDKESELCRIVEKENIGLYVEPENPIELVNAIKILHSNRDDAKENGLRGRQFVEQRFSKEICTSKYIEIIQNLVSTVK